MVIAGEIPDTHYGDKIKSMAIGCENVVFIGFADGKIINELYSNRALYVLPSEIEGLALTLLEAMSAGARCLTSDIPENTDVLKDFGYTFKSFDAESLYRQLSAALSETDDNPREIEQKNYIRDLYNYSRMVWFCKPRRFIID